VANNGATVESQGQRISVDKRVEDHKRIRNCLDSSHVGMVQMWVLITEFETAILDVTAIFYLERREKAPVP
jgi:hypothetical protein